MTTRSVYQLAAFFEAAVNENETGIDAEDATVHFAMGLMAAVKHPEWAKAFVEISDLVAIAPEGFDDFMDELMKAVVMA